MRLSLASKLNLVTASGLLLAAGLSALLVGSLFTLDRGYRGLLAREVHAQAKAREMQVAFKKQVQEWKNILLRGAVPADRARYRKAFLEDQVTVLALADSIVAATPSAPVQRVLLEFRGAYALLDSSYEAAWRRFDAADGRNPFAVDSMVRGKDRGPTDLVDRIVIVLQADVESRVAEQGLLVERRRSLALAGLVLLASALLATPFALARVIVRPVRTLERASARIAEGDLAVRLPRMSDDEIGDLAAAFDRMTASLRGLLRDARSSASAMRATSGAIAAGASEVNDAMLEVAEGAAVIARSAAEQAHSVSEALDATRAVAERAHEIGGGVITADGAARAAEGRTNDGREALARARTKLGEIDAAAEASLPAIAALGERTQAIRGFTDVVARIASQSRLLSLNAAIEAARAGDHGRGFSVVADEMGKLARDSEAALARIRDLALEVEQTGAALGTRATAMRTTVLEGAAAFEESHAALIAIQVDARHAADAVARIRTAMEEQQRRTDALTDLMGSLAAGVEANAATAEQLSAANQEQAAALHQVANDTRGLSAVAERLEGSVGRFVLDEEKAVPVGPDDEGTGLYSESSSRPIRDAQVPAIDLRSAASVALG